MFILLLLFMIGLFAAYSVIEIVGMWNVFKKAGQQGWKALIPIYNTYILYKIAWRPAWFFVLMALDILTWILTGIGGSFVLLFALIILICEIGLSFVMWYFLAYDFGHGMPYGIGLLVIPGIFLAVLGLGDSEYEKGRK